MSSHFITVKHNFETAHRLPFLGGKCENLHGHSWNAEWTWRFELDGNGISKRHGGDVVDYGNLKKDVRGWVDEHLDHGTMLGINDPIMEAGVASLLGNKVFVFGVDNDGTFSNSFPDRPWPTVEAVAELLSFVVPYTRNLVEVSVTETAVNKAIWRA